jgi:hypothetical protein
VAKKPSFGEALRAAWPRHSKWVTLGLVASLTLGLAPYVPHPHVYKQLRSLAHGTLTQPIDIFDLVLHGAPWIVLFVALGRLFADAARR